MKTAVFRRYDLRALALLSCLVWCEACNDHWSTEGGDGIGGVGGISGQGGSSAGGSTAGTGTLMLQAYGGPSGMVAADVPLNEPGVGQQETCTPLVAGACQLLSCLNGGIGSPGRGYGNFGPISVSAGTTTVSLSYRDTGYPTVYFPPPVALGEGDTMTFRGEGNGAGVPPFNVSATIPGLPIITSPVPPTTDGAAIIDTSQDLTVTWMPISIGQVSFTLRGGSVDVGDVSLSVACTFEGASGAGVVPQALLSSIKQMSGASSTYGNLRPVLVVTSVVDGRTIVTESGQNSPIANHAFNVKLQ
jgi:hypothetical protein